MALIDDLALAAAAEVEAIGLATDSTTEVTGGSYTRLAPTYAGSASGGKVDITAALEFDGPANTEVTHLIFETAGGDIFRPVATPRSFNSDGRLNLTSAEITVALAS